jgi:glycosyltransferase involved in cell wall biosynthesis
VISPPADVIVDVRCLQDPNFADRGIGRHAAALLEGARESPGLAHGARLIALHDPALPPMALKWHALFDDHRDTAYALTLSERPAWFVELSPMTHDPLFVARLLDRAALTAAVVYDFIPFDAPERYLADAGTRIDYHTALAWLARYTLFAPISHASAGRLRELVSATRRDVVVTGAPLAPVFEAPAGRAVGTARAHVLVAGGGDARKNVECAVRAHAACPPLQANAVPLVITGSYPPSQLAAMQAVAAQAGGNPALVRVPGRIEDKELAALYGAALCVVVPSLAEGFSLPVVEAMAAGALAVASDIAAHAELIADPSLRFPPDAPEILADILQRLWQDPAAAAQAVALQRPVWPRFRAVAVARRFWAALAARAAAPLPAPAVAVGRKPRVALATPLPPDRSGVADFSAASCAALGADAELHVFTETVAPVRPAGAASVQPLSALPYLSASFDRVISVIGNSEFHLGIHRLLTRYGSACVAHDSRMLGFYVHLFGPQRACAIATRELGRPVSADELTAGLNDEGRLPATLLGEVAAAAAPLFVHSRATAGNLERRFATPVTYLPFPIYRPWDAAALAPAARTAARARLGIAPETIVIASFGFVHWTKAPEDCIWALQQLRAWGVPAALHFVGSHHMDLAGLRALARRLGIAGQVAFGDDYIGEATYRDYLLAADLGLQLRTVGKGAVSGGLQDCVAAGLASVANEDLAAAAEAPAYVRRVPDALSPVLIAEALADLIDAGAHTHRHDAERADYTERHGFPRYARRLYAALGLPASPP